MVSAPGVGAGPGRSGQRCWCCGRPFPEVGLVRLGAHPEAGVCLACAKFLHRRAREQADLLNRDRGPAARGRSVVRACRQQVLRRGWQHGRVSGPVLRLVDRFIP